MTTTLTTTSLIPIKDLQPTQDYVYPAKVINNSDPIEVLEIGERLLIIDGHCRTSKAYGAGQESIPAFVRQPSYYDEASVYGVECSNDFLSKANSCLQRGVKHIGDLPHFSQHKPQYNWQQ